MPDQTKPQPTMYDMFSGMLKDHTGRAEFLDAFKQVVAQIQKLKLSNEQDIAAMREHVRLLSDKVTADNANNFAQAKAEAITSIQTAVSRYDQRIAQMETKVDQKLASIVIPEDGKTPTKEELTALIQEVLPPPPALEETTGELIVNQLEALQGEGRLSVDAIKGLEEFVRKFIPQRSIGSQWGAHPLAIAQSGTVKTKVASRINFTGATVTNNPDGTTTVAVSASGTVVYDEVVAGNTNTFTLAHVPTAGTVRVHGQGQRLRPTTEWTIVGAVITTVDTYTTGQITADYAY